MGRNASPCPECEGRAMTGFFITDWRLGDGARKQLSKHLAPNVIDALEASLIDAKSIWSAKPPSRRKMMSDIKELRILMASLEDAMSGIDDWTAERIQAEAWRPNGGIGTEYTDVPFRDLKHA